VWCERERSLQGGENWSDSVPPVKRKRKEAHKPERERNQREKELKRHRRKREPKIREKVTQVTAGKHRYHTVITVLANKMHGMVFVKFKAKSKELVSHHL